MAVQMLCRYFLNKGFLEKEADAGFQAVLNAIPSYEKDVERLSNIKLLLEAGASVSGENQGGRSDRPLFKAIDKNSPLAITLLLENGVSPKETGRYDLKPLHAAIYHKSVSALQTLLERELPVNERVSGSGRYAGLTPLGLLVERVRYHGSSYADQLSEMATLLLRNGADIDVPLKIKAKEPSPSIKEVVINEGVVHVAQAMRILEMDVAGIDFGLIDLQAALYTKKKDEVDRVIAGDRGMLTKIVRR